MDTDYIDDLCKQWGHRVRSNVPYKERSSLLGRVMEFGPDGANGGDFKANIPYTGMAGDIGGVHIAWRQAPSPMKEVVWMRFVQKGSPDAKARALSMSRAEFYRYLDRFRYFYEGLSEKSVSTVSTG